MICGALTASHADAIQKDSRFLTTLTLNRYAVPTAPSVMRYTVRYPCMLDKNRPAPLSDIPMYGMTATLHTPVAGGLSTKTQKPQAHMRTAKVIRVFCFRDARDASSISQESLLAARV